MNSYNDPRWQKKRLEIMDRDGWMCYWCGAKDKPLNVHHIEYGETLWDVSGENLQTLCEDCHEALGPHPKGGVRWRYGFCYTHCPMCGSTDTKDKGSWDKCNQCGHSIACKTYPPPYEKRQEEIEKWYECYRCSSKITGDQVSAYEHDRSTNLGSVTCESCLRKDKETP